MTQPTKIFFGRDKPRTCDDEGLPKVFLRTLLFSTAKHGRVIESLHLALYHNETHQNFTTWVYGERDQLMLGSGLFVGETGIAANHHFLAPDDSQFRYTEGQYRVDVIARLHGDRDSKLVFSQELTISCEGAAALADPAPACTSSGNRTRIGICRMWTSARRCRTRKISYECSRFASDSGWPGCSVPAATRRCRAGRGFRRRVTGRARERQQPDAAGRRRGSRCPARTDRRRAVRSAT